MKFDAPLAKAEVDRANILIAHHLRRAEIENDVEAVRYFHSTLSRLANLAEKTYIACRKKRLQSLQ